MGLKKTQIVSEWYTLYTYSRGKGPVENSTGRLFHKGFFLNSRTARRRADMNASRRPMTSSLPPGSSGQRPAIKNNPCRLMYVSSKQPCRLTRSVRQWVSGLCECTYYTSKPIFTINVINTHSLLGESMYMLRMYGY